MREIKYNESNKTQVNLIRVIPWLVLKILTVLPTSSLNHTEELN